MEKTIIRTSKEYKKEIEEQEAFECEAVICPECGFKYNHFPMLSQIVGKTQTKTFLITCRKCGSAWSVEK